MTAELAPTRHAEEEVIDIDALTTADLLRERGRVMIEIARIATQLQDKDRRPTGEEDDSSEWDSFREWRRRARWALAHRRTELQDIKQALRERNDISRASRELRVGENQPTEHDLVQIERGKNLREVLAGTDAESLLLRAYRVVRHILTDGQELPATLDQADRDALSLLSIHLRNAYGTSNLKAFVQGKGPQP